MDNKARSYLASNCSGCHGDRAQLVGGDAVRIPPNFDYFDLVQHNTPWDEVPSGYLSDTTAYVDSLYPAPGRAKMKWLAQATGLSKSPFWTMELPPGNPDNLSAMVMYIDKSSGAAKGYPSMSNGMFRQIARRMPAADSAEWYQYLSQAKAEGDAKAIAKLKWIFAAPWGSKAWNDTLKAHNFTLDSVMAGYNGTLIRNDGDQMPPLGTYLADTAALKVLGEWLVNQGNKTAIRGAAKRYAAKTPILSSHRVLFVPSDWKGRVQMLDVQGRATDLLPLGGSRYALPTSVKAGLLLFRIGDKHFKASLVE
jgi:hypothetical protein